MCGILAILGVKSDADASALRKTAIKLSRRQLHRGPDWSGVHVCAPAVIAHERLAIVDVESGEQPLFSEDRSTVLAVNGELYNHMQLRAELDSPSVSGEFLTQSDCEVVIHLFRQALARGESPSAFLSQLRGMFAIVLYDHDTDRVLVARDPIGVCPLYYGRDAEGRLWVASELKVLKDHTSWFKEFPPGHVLESYAAGAEPQRWFSPAWLDKSLLPSQGVDLDRLRELLERSVTRRLMCDVPYGVLLSGGLDSSLVASIAARHTAKRVESGEQEAAWYPRLHTYTIGLKGSPDVAAAKKVADFLGTVHHSFQFTVQQALDALSDVIYHIETYDVTTIRASTPMFLMSRKIKASGTKMVLSGEGADEVFAGYLYFHKAPTPQDLHVETIDKVSALSKYDCLRANKSCMAYGVEPRVPFLDTDLLDYAMGELSPADKMTDPEARARLTKARAAAAQAGTQDDIAVASSTPRCMEKWVLRKAFEGYLPPEVLWRQKEQFSDGVGYSWIDALQARAEEIVSDELFEQAAVRFPVNTPATKEAFWYRQMFEEHFPQSSAAVTVPGGKSIACSTAAAIAWDASFQDCADPSGRAVAGVHFDAYQDDSA